MLIKNLKIISRLLTIIYLSSSLSALQSNIFKYPNPKIAKNLQIKLKGKTKEGKKWIAIDINQVLDPISEIKKLPGKAIAGQAINTDKHSDIERHVQKWKKILEEGSPYSSLFIYTNDNPKERKLIGMIIFAINFTIRNNTKDIEFTIILSSANSKNKDYIISIIEEILACGKEITNIGALNPDIYTNENKDLNDQIMKKFQIDNAPASGMYTTCDLQDNWSEDNWQKDILGYMSPYPYRSIPHIIADFRMNPLGYEEEMTEKAFVKLISDIVPDDNCYSIYMPTGELLTIKTSIEGSIKSVKVLYSKDTYVDRYHKPTPVIVRPISPVWTK